MSRQSPLKGEKKRDFSRSLSPLGSGLEVKMKRTGQQEKAEHFVAAAEAALVTPDMFCFLQRHYLSETTAKRTRLGWNAGGGSVPTGAVVPVLREGEVVAVWIYPEDNAAPILVSGDSDALLCVGGVGLPVLLVQSPLAALLSYQESFGRVAAVAWNGGAPDEYAAGLINAAPQVLACPTKDVRGKAVWQQWKAAFPGAVLALAVGAESLTEMHTAALSWPLNEAIPTVGEWLTAALSIASETAQVCPVSPDNAERGQNCGAERKNTAKAA